MIGESASGTALCRKSEQNFSRSSSEVLEATSTLPASLPASHELGTPLVDQQATRGSLFDRLPGLRWHVLVALVYLCVVIALQLASGAYVSEFGGYPDEPAHYVTSVMVTDYVRHFHFESPLKFAQFYYDHYPKVALGHWPPFFYLLQAGWMLLFSASRTSVRIEAAVTAVILAWSLAQVMRPRFGRMPAFLAGLLLVCIPLMQTYASEEMAELLLTLMCFWSTVWFSRFLHTGRRRDAMLFGTFFALAVLTKGNGWLLAMVPPVAMLLSRRLSMMTRRNFWVPVVLVGLICVPWQLITMRMAERGWDGGPKPSVQYTATALYEFVGLFAGILGPILFLVVLLGIGYALRAAWARRVNPLHASLFALILAVWIFHSLVPAGVEDRKLVIAIPALVFFLFSGASLLIARLPLPRNVAPWRAPLVTGGLAMVFAAGVFQIPKLEHYGFDEAAHYLTDHPQLESSKILVSSSSVGEGLLLSELAMRHPDPRGQVIRATKALAAVDWTGAHYQCLVKSVPELISFLQSNGIQVVVLDAFPPSIRFRHDELLKEAVHSSKNFQRVAVFPAFSAQEGKIEIYKYLR